MRHHFIVKTLLPGIVVAALFFSPASPLRHSLRRLQQQRRRGRRRLRGLARHAWFRHELCRRRQPRRRHYDRRLRLLASALWDDHRTDPLPNPAPISYANSPWLEQSGITQSLADDVNYGEGITIGFVDSGINSAHPAFAGHLSSQGDCYIYCDGGLTVNDVGTVTADGSGHGTKVAMIAAGSQYLNSVGVAPKATVLPIKVYPSDNGATPSADVVAKGARLAADRGANVINISTAPPHGLSAADRANYYKNFFSDISYAASQGTITVFAGGDEGTTIIGTSVAGSVASGFSDAAINQMLFVGGVDSASNLAPGSNTPSTGHFRSSTGSFTWIGDRWLVVRSTDIVVDGETVSGTDYAAAQVAGAVALLELRWPQLKLDGTTGLVLLATATDLGPAGTDATFGHGLLNLPAAFMPQGGISGTSIDGERCPSMTSPATWTVPLA